MFGAPCAYVNHPEYQDSKYDDHAKPGWAAGVSRRNGPLDYSMAAVITESNNEIAVDFGMITAQEAQRSEGGCWISRRMHRRLRNGTFAGWISRPGSRPGTCVPRLRSLTTSEHCW